MKTKLFLSFCSQRSLPLKEKENAEVIQKGRHFNRERDTFSYPLAPIIHIQLLLQLWFQEDGLLLHDLY